MIPRDYFKGKRIAVIGLGHHGEMVEDVKFLIKLGSLVSVYDLKSEARLKNHLVFLRTIGLANYVCGSIPSDDLLDADLIILSHEYSRESTFLKSVKSLEKPIPIEYPETLFFRQVPSITVVGIIGICGKSTLLSMLKPLLETACAQTESQKLYVIDSESNEGILSHLRKIRSGDIVILKMTNQMIDELYELRISPHVAVFTSLSAEDLQSKFPFEILSFQTYNNFIIASDEIVDFTHLLRIQPKAKMLRTKESIIPEQWGWNKLYPIHIREIGALALQTASLFKVDRDIAEDILSKWKPLKGRMEVVKKIKGVEFVNDSGSVNSISTLMAVKNLSKNKNLVLIFGGARTKGDYQLLYEALSTYVHTVILLPGSGTIVERNKIEKLEGLKVKSAPDVEEAVRIAMDVANKGDIVLFSPAFEAIGVDVSRKDRGERFVRAVRGL